MMVSHLFKTVSLSGFLLLFSLNTYSQVSENENGSSSDFSLIFSAESGGFYFQDPAGTSIAIEGIPYEGAIDEQRYILGVNDLISIEVEANQRLILKSIVINSSGDIVLPTIGVVKLGGLTLPEARAELEKVLSETYLSPDVSISVDVPRKINIHIAGSVPNPGKFIIPAQSRVDLAILQAVMGPDLPNLSGNNLLNAYTSQLLNAGTYSMRNIMIHHPNGETTKADLVDYFRTGDLDSNPIVLDGDRIVIPRRSYNSPTVSITGALRYGYELEYKQGETIADLLDIAEGFEENADSSKALVFRRNAQQVERIEVPSEEWNTFVVQPNDRVVIPELSSTNMPSTAWVTGEVRYPGNFPIISGESTVAELIELSGGITNYALPQASYLIRAGNLVNEIPNKFNAELMSRTSNQYVQGLEYLKQETALSKDRVYIDLNNTSELKNIPLFDGDRLFIPKDEKTIFVFGQVNNPGYFPYLNEQGLTVNDYIKRAGGFALSADMDRVFIIKAGNSSWYKPGDTELESGDRIFVDRIPVEDLNALRTYEIQRQQIRNTRIQLIMTGITTITGIITTYVAIQNLR